MAIEFGIWRIDKKLTPVEYSKLDLESRLQDTVRQLMTYAAELHAASIVWIADRFRDEHRAAIHDF